MTVFSLVFSAKCPPLSPIKLLVSRKGGRAGEAYKAAQESACQWLDLSEGMCAQLKKQGCEASLRHTAADSDDWSRLPVFSSHLCHNSPSPRKHHHQHHWDVVENNGRRSFHKQTACVCETILAYATKVGLLFRFVTTHKDVHKFSYKKQSGRTPVIANKSCARFFTSLHICPEN